MSVTVTIICDHFVRQIWLNLYQSTPKNAEIFSIFWKRYHLSIDKRKIKIVKFNLQSIQAP